MTHRALLTAVRLALIAVFVFTAAVRVVLYWHTKKTETRSVVSQVVQPVPVAPASLVEKGFWQSITVEDDGESTVVPAFFCQSSGAYKGHIVDSGQGWFTVYHGGDKDASYASLDFAKGRIESKADCE